MGQYHYLVNLDKKQVVHPHQIGNGLKLREQVGWEYCTATALVMLLASASKDGGRGGGDFRCGHPLVGSWAGDRIAFVGDYAEADDIPGVNAQDVYAACSWATHHEVGDPPPEGDEQKKAAFEAESWTDISTKVREMMCAEFDIRYEGGDGWLGIKENGKDETVPCATKPDMVITVPVKQ